MQEAYIPIIYPSSHAANLVLLANGDILCAYYSGRWENASDLAIAVARLRHGSNRWTAPENADHETGYAFQNPVLFQSPEGPVWLFHTSQKEQAGEALAEIYRQISNDNGYHWSDRKVAIPPSSYDRQPLVVAGSRWLMPMYYTPRGQKKDVLKDYSAVQISQDRGETWKPCVVPDSGGLAQPDLVMLRPGRYLMFFRSRFADWIYRSTSTDACTWTKPEPTQLPNNNASMQAVLLNDGHLVMAFNNTQAKKNRDNVAGNAARVPLSVALSTDGGKTWPWVRDIEAGNLTLEPPVPNKISGVVLTQHEKDEFNDHLNTYEYPAILQAKDGRIYVAYSYHRRTIKCVNFEESWIKQGGTIGIFKGDKIAGR
ncbi:MAG TPA: sialidase family protein [Bryobacteraceae bacterium]|nr:sialidase family protein [Bryobacteraceae bacterium]